MKRKKRKIITPKKKKKIEKEAIGETLNLEQTRFCEVFTRPGSETYNNATLSYAEAYSYDLDSMSRDAEYDKPKDIKNRKKIRESEYDRACAVCAVSGKYLLRNPKILDKIKKRYLELFGDNDSIDAEHAKVIYQDEDWNVKLSAIRDANKLKKRLGIDDDTKDPNAQPVTRIEIVLSENMKALAQQDTPALPPSEKTT